MISGRAGPVSEFLSILKVYMADVKAEVEDETTTAEEELHLQEVIPTMIDKAIVEIKSKNETIAKMEKDMRDLMVENRQMNDYKSQLDSLERKQQQKVEEIAILRDTIKTLYQENQRLNAEKASMSKQLITTKENLGSAKKKLKRIEEENNGYKGDLRKATQMAEERLDEYIKNDQQMQQQIKTLTNQNERMKSDLARKEKSLTSANKKIQQLKEFQLLYQQYSHQNEVLRQEKKSLTGEQDSLREKYLSEKRKLLQENESLLKQLQKQNQRVERQTQQYKHSHTTVAQLMEKCTSYEQQIMSRTDKIKEKNRQIRIFTDQLNKMTTKVEDLSKMADNLMNDNDSLRQNLTNAEAKIDQFKQFYVQLGRIKGELNTKKSSEFAKLTESLETLARLNVI